MAFFPLFIDLKGKTCVVIGGGKVATRKIYTLLQFEPFIKVISPKITEEISELESQKKIVVQKKIYSKKYSYNDLNNDLKDAFILVVATSDRTLNHNIFKYAMQNNIFVNIADNKDECNFYFPSIVKRSDLVVGISSSGGYPAFTKKVKEQIDNILPIDYANKLEFLKNYREKIEKEILDINTRKEFLNKILEEVILSNDISKIDITKIDITKLI